MTESVHNLRYQQCVDFVKMYYSLDYTATKCVLKNGPTAIIPSPNTNARHYLKPLKHVSSAIELASFLYTSTCGIINHIDSSALKHLHNILYKPVIEVDSLFALSCLTRISSILGFDDTVQHLQSLIYDRYIRHGNGLVLSTETLYSYGHQSTHILFLFLLNNVLPFKIYYSLPNATDPLNQSLVALQRSLSSEIFKDMPPTHSLNEFYFFPALLSAFTKLPKHQPYRTSHYDFGLSALFEAYPCVSLLPPAISVGSPSPRLIHKKTVFISLRTAYYKNDAGFNDHRNQDPNIILNAVNELAMLFSDYYFILYPPQTINHPVDNASNLHILLPGTSFEQILSIQRTSIACILPASGAAWAPPLYFHVPTLAYDAWSCDVGKYYHPSLIYHFRPILVDLTPSSPYRACRAAGQTENYTSILNRGVRLYQQDPSYYVLIFKSFLLRIHNMRHFSTQTFLSHHLINVL